MRKFQVLRSNLGKISVFFVENLIKFAKSFAQTTPLWLFYSGNIPKYNLVRNNIFNNIYVENGKF